MTRKAVVLLSGGVDSTTVAMFAASKGFDLYILSFSYGQRHSVEIEKAKKVVDKLPSVVGHKIITIDLSFISNSALTSSVSVPKDAYYDRKNDADIPVTYVPGRNTIFLSYASSFAESIGSKDIFIGANVIDYSNYPDCRPEYLQAMEKTINLGTKQGVQGKKIKIHAPFLLISKAAIVKKGMELGVDYSQTISCYDPDQHGRSCGHCDACILRKEAFSENGLSDPIEYYG
ncbi:MAG: 7-cyano-7-deazaguanine synthase QueC [Rickettsiales bacterium]|nr:7-cyano-7-deazaguanine synthase QueC [Rickettsiales bacterium]